MCKWHPGQSKDQGTKINKTNTFVLKENKQTNSRTSDKHIELAHFFIKT